MGNSESRLDQDGVGTRPGSRLRIDVTPAQTVDR